MAIGHIVIGGPATAACEDRAETLTASNGRARLFTHADGHKTVQIQLDSEELFWAPDGDPREPQRRLRLHLCATVNKPADNRSGNAVAAIARLAGGFQSGVHLRYRGQTFEALEDVDLSVAVLSPESLKVSLRAVAGSGQERLRFFVDANVARCAPELPISATMMGYLAADKMLVDEDFAEAAYLPAAGISLKDNPCLTDAVLRAFGGGIVGHLDLSRTSITGDGLSGLEPVAHVREARFDGSLLNDRGFRNLTGFRGLQTLSCQHTRVTDAALAALSGLKELKSLILNNTQITGSGFADACDLPELAVIDLSGCHVSSSALHTLLKFKRLRRLSLDRCGLMDADMPALMPLIERLDYIGLYDNSISDAAFKRIKDQLPGARILGRRNVQ